MRVLHLVMHIVLQYLLKKSTTNPMGFCVCQKAVVTNWSFPQVANVYILGLTGVAIWLQNAGTNGYQYRGKGYNNIKHRFGNFGILCYCVVENLWKTRL